MKMKKLVAGLLSAAMVFTSVSVAGVQMDTVQAAVTGETRVNLARTSQTAESGNEGAGHTVEKLIDGDKTNNNSRWASQRYKIVGEWVSFSWKEEKTVQEIRLYPERGEGKNDDNANMTGYDITVKNTEHPDGVVVYSERDHIIAAEEVIVLPQPVKASEVKLTIQQNRNAGWENASFYEVEIYETPSVEITAQDDYNFAQVGTTAASSSENAEMNDANIIDGDIRNTRDGKSVNAARWSSNNQTNTAKQWVELDLGKAVSIKEVDLELFVRNVNPMPSNMKVFDLEFTLGDNKFVKRITNTKVNSTDTGYNNKIDVVLDIPVVAQKVKLCNVTIGDGNDYPQLSVVEMGVYSNVQTNAFAGYTLDVTNNIAAAGTVAKTAAKDPVPETDNKKYVLGAEVTLTATSNTNYKFVEWKKDGVQLSTNTEQKVIVNGDVAVQAVFEATNRAALAEKLAEAEKLTADGYTADTWNTFNTAKEAARTTHNDQTSTFETIEAKIAELTTAMNGLVRKYTVNVVNGKLAGELATTAVVEGTGLTVTADAAQPGQKFSHWELLGKPVCYASTYTFTVYNDTTLTAVYVKDTTQIEKKASMFCTATFDPATSVIKFTAKRSVPAGATIVRHGMILTNQVTWNKNFVNTPENFILGNRGMITKTGTTKGLLGNYSAGVKCTKPNTWYAKGYVEYTLNGKTETVYSDVVSYTVK